MGKAKGPCKCVLDAGSHGYTLLYNDQYLHYAYLISVIYNGVNYNYNNNITVTVAI